MHTEILAVDARAPAPARIARAAEVLRGGGLVAFPTETVYGLGALALDANAVRGIFAAKGRPANNPLIVHIADISEVLSVAAAWPDAAERLARRFWPGPLTLIVPRGAAVPDATTAGGPTVALRVPAHPVARALLRAVGAPLAAPSANRSSELSPTCAEHVLRGLDGRIDLVLDGGPTTGGVESTVLDVTTSPPRLLRPGLIGPAELEAVIGPVVRPPPPVPPPAGGGGAGWGNAVLPSPGMLPRHYAPRTLLECTPDGRNRVEELIRAGARIGWMTFSTWSEDQSPRLIVQTMPTDAVGYAARLYATLHILDDAGLDRIIVDLPPEGDEWLAVRDRLRRAAH
jgi:L-threonylcarbamoyladenylate synthase